MNQRNFPYKTSPRMGCLLTGLALTAAVFLFNPFALAQSGPGGPGGPPPHPGGHWEGPGGGPGPLGFGRNGFPKVVTGEPYSGQAVTTMTQTLPNGSHITRQITASIARDSEGRAMRTESFNGFGGAGGPGVTITTIFDPVANQRIELNTKNKTARVFVLPASSANSGAGRDRGPRGPRAESASVQTQSLGSQTIDGVPAEGTRTNRTIAAGAIGNDTALQSTDERWYSPDLQMVVQSTRTDPRFGQTSYVINNLQRSEPSAALFQVPAGYQTKTIELPARPPSR